MSCIPEFPSPATRHCPPGTISRLADPEKTFTSSSVEEALIEMCLAGVSVRLLSESLLYIILSA